MKKGTYIRFKDFLNFDYNYYLIPKDVLNSFITNNAKVLFTALHRFRGDKNNPTNRELSLATGINVSLMSSILKELEENDFITKKGRGRNRTIEPYEKFEYIQQGGYYVRIPSFIQEHQEMNSTHKVLYFILLDIYFFHLNVMVKEINDVLDLYTNPISRKRLAHRLDCSKDNVSLLVKDLSENFIHGDKFIIGTDKTAYYANENLYKCNLITPTTKKGREQLMMDLEVKENKKKKSDFVIEDSL